MSAERKFCRVIQPGALTTVQDKGRFGYQRFGMSPGGVMDRAAYREANWLLNNPEGAAVLEMTIAGAKLEILSAGRCAICGADMGATLNGAPAPRSQAFAVSPGDVLQFGMVKNGLRTYLAVGGGFDVPIVMGSRSTNLKCAMGGFLGRALKAGDELAALPDRGGEARELTPQVYLSEIVLRYVAGPQQDMFPLEVYAAFNAAEYVVSPQSDRMGCRLDGCDLPVPGGTDIVSDGIAFGSIQVANSGQPIVLLADRQTTGGYAKIGTVISDDLPLLAQALPGTKVKFLPVTVASI